MSEKYAPQERYAKANHVQVKFSLNKKTDADILAWLEAQPNKAAAFKAIVRAVINAEKK